MHKFSPENAERLERPERYALLDPVKTLERFGLGRGMHFLDVGMGTGFFSRAAADLVGPEGKVSAVDISPELIEYVRQRGIPPNVALLHCSEYSIPLPDRSADFALLAFVLHENAEKDRFLNEIFRVLAPGGRMLILEWKRQVEEHGPPPGERLGETELDHLLSRFMLLEGGSLNSSHYYRLIQKRPSAPSPERAAEGARARDQNPNPTPTDVSKSE